MTRSDKEIFEGLSDEAKQFFREVLELERKYSKLDKPIKDSADKIYKMVKGYYQ